MGRSSVGGGGGDGVGRGLGCVVCGSGYGC